MYVQSEFQQKPTEGPENNDTIHLYRRAFLSISEKMQNCQIECAGAIYRDGTYSFYQGHIDSVKVSSEGDVIWHSHPDGNLIFSLQDWLCFFYSEAENAALFAGKKILIIKKTDNYKKLREILIKEASSFHGYPSVITQRFLKTVESFFSVDLSKAKEEELFVFFKPDFEIIEVESVISPTLV